MQEGSVIREQRKLGPDVWCYRWWESGPTGNRVHRRIVLGTAEELRDMSTARQMTTGLIREINASDIRLAGTSMTLAPTTRAWPLEWTNRALYQEDLSGLSWQVDRTALGRLPPAEHQGSRSGVVA